MSVNLYRVILPVTDIERAVTFYAELLEAPGSRVSPGRHYFECGGTILACFDPCADGDAIESRPNQGHLYFSVSDLNAAHERATSAGRLSVDASVATMPWGEKCFYGEDPFGNPFCFVDDSTCFTGES
ncbi:MAG: VOC family protein [Candidatus Latescibacteria bacterium]|jgi:uncharacterized glyoxalase superfamily protein PhnB|nr:VOC family protein [Candidatus Latescibacterota bacterium]